MFNPTSLLLEYFRREARSKHFYLLIYITLDYICLYFIVGEQFLDVLSVREYLDKLEYILQLFLADFEKGSSRLTIETSKIILIICSSLKL